MDTSEPVVPAASTSANGAAEAPKSLGGWFSSNLMPILFVGAVIALIVYKGLIVWDVALAVFGLGMVIFIHELGHFLAAKFCDVHVETFSIGFGKAIPGCSFQKGETLYKIGWIPLGGFVKMVGEGDNADTEEAYEDPRSFKNKPVWQRMLIISAGVIMNLILGCICFMVAYTHGVEETPAIIGTVAVGSPAWEQDLRTGDRITQIDGITKPTFDDIRPTVMSAAKDGSVPFMIQRFGQSESKLYDLVPRRRAEDLYPTVGINPINQLMLAKSRRPDESPVRKNSPASISRAKEDGSEFRGGDKIVASSHDPANPGDVQPIVATTADEKLKWIEFSRRQHRMRGQPMTLVVDRNGEPRTFVVESAYATHIPGVRWQMGRLAAMRINGPAAKAALVTAGAESALQVSKSESGDNGDRIIAVEVKEGGKVVRFVEEFAKEKEANVDERRFDPLRLNYDLESWAERTNERNVRITVLRAPTGETKVGKRVVYDLTWDPSLVDNGETIIGASAPMALSGLGLAYYVDATVDSAEEASPLKRGDIVTEVRFAEIDAKGEAKPGEWEPVKQFQGAYLQSIIQRVTVREIDLKVQRAGGETEVRVVAVSDLNQGSWPVTDRGLFFSYETQIQKADGLLEAVGMGLHRTLRTVRVIYQTLYATVFRQISAKTMSGPLSIANVSYKIAGYDLWQFILFIGLININLAVVNFLPIPILDGGHMVFLIYEKIRGKPAPEKIQEYALYVGLAFILLLMAFVIFLDVRKLWF